RECLSGNGKFFIEARAFFGGIEGDLEFRTLVFLDAERHRTLRAVHNSERHATRHAIGGRREATRERTVLVAAMLPARDFLAVRIVKDHLYVGSREGIIIIFFLIHSEADALVLDDLSGPIDSAIGEEDGLVLVLRLVTLLRRVLVLRNQFAAIVPHAEEIR